MMLLNKNLIYQHFIIIILILIITVIQSMNGQQCQWEYIALNNIQCHINKLENTTVDFLQDAEGTSKLIINCTDPVVSAASIPLSPSLQHIPHPYYEESQLSTKNNIFLKLNNLKELIIDRCKLLQLPNGIFQNLKQLRKLDIQTENLQWSPAKTLEINSQTFYGLIELEHLNLMNNNLRSLPVNALCSLQNLKSLNLTKNRIRSMEQLHFINAINNNNNQDQPQKEIDKDYHNKLCDASIIDDDDELLTDITNNKNRLIGPELQTLDLSYNELYSIGDLVKLKYLQNLYLQHNNLTELFNHTFSHLKSLRILNLSYNRLEQLPSGLFHGVHELHELHLNNNNLYELSITLFQHLDQLLILDLSANQLSSYHINTKIFQRLIRLIILNLSNNAITRLDAETFSNLYFLQILNLQNNSIGHIDDNTFFSLYNLHTLNLGENRLHTLNGNLFNGLIILSKLQLNNNLITHIDEMVFKNFTDLKELDLSSNQLQTIPKAVQYLISLKSLDLGENQINEIHPQSFRNLNQLTGLRLIDNQIGNLTKLMFAELPKLSVLNLAKNNIHSIERGIFHNNTELEAIRLDRNYLTDINGIFSTISSLLWLNLSENLIVWFDYAFIPQNLKWLDIHGNYIESLSNYYKLQEEINLKTLDASHNRIEDIQSMSIPNSIELLFINNNFIQFIQINTFIDKIRLIRCDLYANKLKKLQLNQIRLAPWPQNKNLPEFYLGGNPFECDCTMEWLQQMNHQQLPPPSSSMSIINNDLDQQQHQNGTLQLHPRQYPRIMDIVNIDCYLLNNHKRGIYVQKPLIELQTSHFLCLYETHCFALCHCCDFDACDCEMTCPTNCTCYHDQTWTTNIVDCGATNNINKYNTHNNQYNSQQQQQHHHHHHRQQQQHENQQLSQQFIPNNIPMDTTILYLDGLNLIELQNHSFIGRKNLRTLFINSSNIQQIQNRTFEQSLQQTLQILHLEDNYLTIFNGYEFEYLFNLIELYLENNRLKFINSKTFQALNKLQILRLDGNNLMALNIELSGKLISTSINAPRLFGTQLKSLSIGRNRWTCSCKYLPYLIDLVIENAVIIQDLQDIYCLNKNDLQKETFKYYDIDFNKTKQCTTKSTGGGIGGDDIDNDFSDLEHIHSYNINMPNNNKQNNNNLFISSVTNTLPSSSSSSSSSSATTAISTNDNFLTKMYIPFIIIIILIIILLIVLIIIFLFRKSIRYWFHKKYDSRNGLNNMFSTNPNINKILAVSGPRNILDNDNDKYYDATIFYSIKDNNFVMNELCNELEYGGPQSPQSLRLCLQYRDLLLPQTTTQAATQNQQNPLNDILMQQNHHQNVNHLKIYDAVKSSKNIIIILSRNFLQTEWLNYNVRLAINESIRERLHKLLFIIYDSDPQLIDGMNGPSSATAADDETILMNSLLVENENNYDLLELLKITTIQRIYWNDKYFWEKLRYAFSNTAIIDTGIATYHPNHHHHNIHNTNNQQRTNNYTLEHQQHLHQSSTSNAAAATLFRQQQAAAAAAAGTSPIPGYYPQQQTPHNHHHHHHQHPHPHPHSTTSHHHQHQESTDEANYSSATTATPSPRPIRRNLLTNSNNNGSGGGGGGGGGVMLIDITQRPPSEHIYSSIDSDYSGFDNNTDILMGNTSQRMSQQQQPQPQQHQWRPTSTLSPSSTTPSGTTTASSTTSSINSNTKGNNNGRQQSSQHVQAYLV